jgi:hypothetical protein
MCTRCPVCLVPRYDNFYLNNSYDIINNNNNNNDDDDNNNNNNNNNNSHSDDNNSKHKGKFSASCTQYRYFPIAYRLRQLFRNKLYSSLFKYADSHMHDYRKIDDDYGSYDKLEDICHAPIWREFAKMFPLYSENSEKGICDRRVGFILSLDSASMSKFLSPEFSITPYILSILNFPIWFRCKPQHMLFTGISPANAKNTALYLGMLAHIFKHSVCMYVYKYVRMYEWIGVCMYVCMYVCMHMHNNI